MTTELRILTVRQPWAWAIIHGGKDVENRVRNVAGGYRGPIAIHAAKADDPEAWTGLVRTNLGAWGRAMESPLSLVGGAIIGVVDLVGAHVVQQSHAGTNVCFDNTTPTGDICSRWAHAYDEFPAYRGHHLVLANPRPVTEPIAYKGALGLRRLDEETTAAVWSQIGA
jgi:hypothetical protein